MDVARAIIIKRDARGSGTSSRLKFVWENLLNSKAYKSYKFFKSIKTKYSKLKL